MVTTPAIGLKDIMWINATKTVRDWRKAILLNSAKKMVDFSNVVSGNGRKVIHFSVIVKSSRTFVKSSSAWCCVVGLDWVHSPEMQMKLMFPR